eukprot:4363072-Alexandrium_andersonii.AAC.1
MASRGPQADDERAPADLVIVCDVDGRLWPISVLHASGIVCSGYCLEGRHLAHGHCECHALGGR